ncbi:MaoC family dehydratase [Bowmanella denitrificans]|uniref:MaoC family dehydratase n=1 Tax=Bowmanella denitrificans TaxID=366582 RepID=UPI0015587F69|nr:MaoC/PaaZ C-terminal domain-containing protein [Bowmanella denitrificans]
MNIRQFTPESLPKVPAMLLRAAVKSGQQAPAPQLPELVLRCEGLKADSDKLDEYHELLAWDKEQVHPCWLHCLALPLHLGLLLDKGFPFKVMGLVHMENHITQYRPVSRHEKLSISCRFDKLRRHRLGWQFSLLTDIQVGEEMVWQGRSVSLVRQGDLPKRSLPSSSANLPAGQLWHLDASLGRQYAKVSGDYNPIHLYPWSARFFGFKSQIIHGMWSKARCITALAPLLGEAYSLSVSFRKPVFLPCEVSFHAEEGENGGSFTLGSAGGQDLHLSGKYQPVVTPH